MLKLLIILVAGYLLLTAYLYVSQGSMLYLPNMPSRQLIATPGSIDLDFEDVTLETSDGVSVHGWYVPADSERVLLYFHGNAGNISHRIHSIREFRELGLSVFMIDYRGYGQSTGKPTEHGLYRDAEAAWRYLTAERGIAPENVVVFGRSLGGSVASWLAMNESPGALIVDSSFTSVADVGQEVYPWLPVRLLARYRHPTREHVENTNVPVLVVHSRDDEIIPFRHGEAIFEAANEPKAFLEIRGGHNDAHATSAAAYFSGLRRFLDSL